MAKHSKKKLKVKIKDPKRLIIIILIITVALVIVNINKNKIYKKEEMSLVINNEDVTQKLKNDIITKGNVQYLSLEDIKKCIDSDIYQEDNLIITGSDKKISVIELDKNKIEINGSVIEINGKAFKTEQGIIYLPISEMKNVYDIEFSYIEEYKNIVISNYSKRVENAKAKKNLLLKREMNESSANLEKIQKGNSVEYIYEEKGWAKIRTQNGNLGYVKKKNLVNFEVVREDMHETKEIASNIVDYKKNITERNIKKYKNRKEIIEEIIAEAVNKKKQAVKIIYKNDKNEESFKRFKLESTAFLKECGISVIFE